VAAGLRFRLLPVLLLGLALVATPAASGRKIAPKLRHAHVKSACGRGHGRRRGSKSPARCRAKARTRKPRHPSPRTAGRPAPPPSPPAAPGAPSGPPTPGGSLPFLHQQGTQVVDSSGKPVKLRGVDLGGWLLWEGWIFGGGYTGESAIVDRLSSLVGASAAQQFHTEVQNQMVSEADIAQIAKLGFNAVRVPFNYRLLEDPSAPGVYKASGWAILDNLVSWAQKHHVYLILDMHAAPGGQAFGFIYDDPAWPLIWGSSQAQSDMVAMWQAIAARYHDASAIAGYDLLNEPWTSGAQLSSLYARTIAGIRAVDQRHMIILEGAHDARDFSWATKPLDSNMVYSAHMYLWSQTNAQQQLNAYAQMAQAQQVPLWIGEFGENTSAADASQVAMFDAQPTVVGWSFWTWKQAYGWGVYTIPVSANWKALIGWLCGNSTAEPTVAQATQGMQDFLSAIQIGNETESPGTVAALAVPTPGA
jgi:endoglucanase